MIGANTYPILKFTGKQFKGGILRAPRMPPEFQFWRNHFAGVRGENEIRGKGGGRQLDFEILIFGGFSGRDDIFKYIESDINGPSGLLGDHGKLELSNSSPRWKHPWENCTFEGFAQTMDYLPDVATTIDGGWFTTGVLTFRQLGS